MPIIEPEVDIHSPTKVECEEMLKAAIHRNLDALDDGTEVMLKLSLPSIDNFYADLIDHPRCSRSWPCRAGTAVTNRTRSWPARTA